MKKILLLLLLCLFVGACTTFKKREELQKAVYEEMLSMNSKQQFLQMNQEFLATQGANETEEVAFFVDSVYFHPDSGLRLKPSFVKAKIRMVTTSFNHLQQYRDTLRSQFYANAQMAKKIALQQEIKSRQHKQQNAWFFLEWLLLLLALAGSYCLWKRFSPLRFF